MQSIDDEIPDLSGPVSLGTYKFTRRARGKKYESHKSSELENIDEKEGEIKATESRLISSPHSPSNPPPATTNTSSQLPVHPTEAVSGQLNPQASGQGYHSIPPVQYSPSTQGATTWISQNKPSSGTTRQVHHSFSPQLYPADQQFSATNHAHRQSSQAVSRQAHHHSVRFQDNQDHIRNQTSYPSINPGRQNSKVSGQAYISRPLQNHSSNPKPDLPINAYALNSQATSGQSGHSFPPQNHSLLQGSHASINPYPRTSQATSRQGHNSFPHQAHNLNKNSYAPISPYARGSQATFRQGLIPFPRQGHRSNQNPYAPINIDRRSKVSGQARPSFPLPERHRDTSEVHGELTKSLNALIVTDKQRLTASGQASPHPTSQDLRPHTTQTDRKSEREVENPLGAHRQSSQDSSQGDRLARPKGYSSSQPLPLSNTLPTAIFNLRTNQWEPDPPKANMPAQTPTNKPTRGGHSGQQSSRQSSRVSHASQNIRNPYAISCSPS